jgi:hypothetical protein
MASPIENAQRIWEIFKLILQLEEGIRNDIQEVKEARALLVLLNSMAGNGNTTYNSKELRFVLPNANRNWNVHCYDMRNPSSFIINFRPDSTLMMSKQIGVNMSLLSQLPHIPIIVVSGRDGYEINTGQRVTAKVIVDWMQKQEDELTMAYGRRERERLRR